MNISAVIFGSLFKKVHSQWFVQQSNDCENKIYNNYNMNNLNVARYSNRSYDKYPGINQAYQSISNSAAKNPSKENSITKSFTNTIKAFCNQTTVHGLKNVIDSFNEFKTANSRYGI